MCDATTKAVREISYSAKKNKAYSLHTKTLAAGNILAPLGLGIILCNKNNSLTQSFISLGCTVGACYLFYKSSQAYAKYREKDPWIKKREARDDKEQKILAAAQNIENINGDIFPGITWFVQIWHTGKNERDFQRLAHRVPEQTDTMAANFTTEKAKMRSAQQALERDQELKRMQELHESELQERQERQRIQREQEQAQYEAAKSRRKIERITQEREREAEDRQDWLHKLDGRHCIPIEGVQKILRETGFFQDTNTIIVDYLKNGYILHLNKQFLRHSGSIENIRYSPDGEKLAVAMQDASVIILSTNNWDEIDRFRIHINDHAKDVLLWSPDSTQIIAGSNLIRSFKTNTKITTDIEYDENDTIARLIYHPIQDTHMFACQFYWKENIIIYDAQTGKKIQRFKNATAIAFSPDGKTFALLNKNGAIQIRAIKDIHDPKKILRTFTLQKHTQSQAGHCLAYSPNGNQLISYKISPYHTMVKIWSLLTKDNLSCTLSKNTQLPSVLINIVVQYATEEDKEYNHPQGITSVTYAPDGKTFLIVGSIRNKVIDLDTLQSVGSFETRDIFDINNVSINGDGTYASDSNETVTFDSDATILIGDGHGKLVQTIPGLKGAHSIFAQTLPGHASTMSQVTYNPVRLGELASSDESGVLKIWHRTGYIIDEYVDDIEDQQTS